MSKTYYFGYNKEEGRGTQSGIGFKRIQKYDEPVIRKIKDRTAGVAEDLPVAVPSPFAIMSLVKSAFDNVIYLFDNKVDVNGRITKNHDDNVWVCTDDIITVLNTLDLAELVFKGEIQCEKLDQQVINDLIASSDGRHKNLGAVLDLYKDTDNNSLGLAELKFPENPSAGTNFKFYLLMNGEDVVGGTSGATLFFPTRNKNKLEEFNEKLNDNRGWFNHSEKVGSIISGTHDGIAAFLEEDFSKRDIKFQEWIIQLLYGNETPIGKYIKQVRKRIGENGKKRDVTNQELNQWRIHYSNITTDGKVLISPMKVYDSIETIIEARRKAVETERSESSERDAKQAEQKDKLIHEANIKNDKIKEQLRGMNLPDMEKKLEILKIFSDYIVEIPYKPSGHFEYFEKDGHYFLYPINENYDGNEKFELYVQYEDIENKDKEKRKLVVVVQMTENKDINRIYSNNGKSEPTLEQGVIVKGNFNVALFPFVNNAKEYRIQLVEDLKNSKIESDFNTNKVYQNNHYIRRKENRDKRDFWRTTYLKKEQNNGSLLDKINLSMKLDNNSFDIRLIPNFPDRKYEKNNEKFLFAVDFGTTNTHIAYKVEGDPAPQCFVMSNYLASMKDFGNGEDDNLLDDDMFSFMLNEFLPIKIGNRELKTDDPDYAQNYSKYGFPLRTILLCDEDADKAKRKSNNLPYLGMYNIPFGYGGLLLAGYKPYSNLKWASEDDKDEIFLKEIIFLLYTKVLIEGGTSSLAKTDIYFSYPLSMDEHSVKKLVAYWQSLYTQFFDGSRVNDTKGKPVIAPIKKVAESFVPVKYFLEHPEDTDFENKSLNALDIENKLALCVDIGGGTTDFSGVIRADDIEKVVFQSSMRFASNSIFGGSVHPDSKTKMQYNYLTAKYEKVYIGDLSDKYDNSERLLFGTKPAIFADIAKYRDASEINSCLFSFDTTIFKSEDRKGYRYNEKLKNDCNNKIVFLYYFTVVIYHLAKSLEKKYAKSEIPNIGEIIFSGNGSKVLDILDIDSTRPTLQNIVKKVFSEILGKENEILLRFKPDKSKVLTAEGSLCPRDIQEGEKKDEDGDYVIEKIDVYDDKYIGKNISDIEKNFVALNKLFIEVLTPRFNKFNINETIFNKVKAALLNPKENGGKIDNILIMLKSKKISEEKYIDLVNRHQYTEICSPMIPFELLIFKLFEILQQDN